MRKRIGAPKTFHIEVILNNGLNLTHWIPSTSPQLLIVAEAEGCYEVVFGVTTLPSQEEIMMTKDKNITIFCVHAAIWQA